MEKLNSQKQYEVLRWASLFLEKHNREPRVAEILLQHHLNMSRSQFFMNMRENLLGNVVKKFTEDILQHAETGIPIQHLTGYETFFGRDFIVTKDVLIPRPETEELVQQVIVYVHKYFSQDESYTIVDLGTGSGIIAITLALELPNATIYATDISEDALKIAQQNAQNFDATNICFLRGDFLQPLINQDIKPDIVVSNPPYIAKQEKHLLTDTVKNFDPELALFADENGLAAYKTIINQLAIHSEPNTMLFFEIGHTQSKAITELIKYTFPKSTVKTIQDINGKDRIIAAKLM